MAKSTVRVGWKFARALFELSKQEDYDAIEAALIQAAEDYSSHAELSALLANPMIPVSGRQGVLAEYAGLLRAGDETFKNFMLTLFESGKLDLLPAIAQAFGELVARFRKLFMLSVTTAFPVTDAERREIAETVRRTVPEQFASLVQIEWQLDAAIIGGMQVRAGDKVIDGTVRGALERLSQTLT